MAKFTLKKLSVKVTEDEGNSFEVRGLSPNDLAQLLMLHNPIMEQLFNQYAMQEADDLNAEQLADAVSVIAVGVLEQAPHSWRTALLLRLTTLSLSRNTRAFLSVSRSTLLPKSAN